MTGCALYHDKEGTLYHINGVEQAGRWRNLMLTLRTSTDNGQTWTQPRIIAPEHTMRHQVIAGTFMTREGWMIQPCDATPSASGGTAIHISKDKGQTWTDPWDGRPSEYVQGGKGTTIAGIHAGVVQLKDGRLMALGRKNNIKDKDGRERMPMSISDDMGKTWTYSASEFPPLEGHQRLVLTRLNEGPLLFVSFTDHPYRTPENERGLLFTDKDGNAITYSVSEPDTDGYAPTFKIVKGSVQPAQSSSEKLTAAEKKLLELYRAADSQTKKDVIKLLKGEEESADSVLESLLGVVQGMLEDK